MTGQRTQSPKQVAATKAHLAAMAVIKFRYENGQRIIVVETPAGDELYSGTDFKEAAEVRIDYNHAISVQPQSAAV